MTETSGAGEGVEFWTRQAGEALEALRALGIDAFAHDGRLIATGDTNQVYRVFFEAMGEAAATIDDEGVILHANTRLAAIFRTSLDALRGSSLLGALEGLPMPLPESASWRGRVLLHAGGGAHPCLCTIVVIGAAETRPFRCVVLSDLADLERAQRDADEGQRALAGLAAAAPGGLFRARWIAGIAALEFATDGVFRLFGVPRPMEGQGVGSLWATLPPSARAALACAWRDRGDSPSLACEFNIPDAMDGVRWLGLEARREWRDGGEEVWNGYVHDITQAKRGEEERRLAAAVFQSVRQGIMVTSPQGDILHVNPGFELITGYRADEAIGRPAKMLASGLTPKDVYAGLWAALLETGHWEGELVNRRRSGDVYHELLTVDAVTSADGGVACYVGVFSDISARKKREELNLFAAQHDRLTGLLNRSVLDERLPALLSHAERHRTACSLLYVDLDHFKAINDSLGHEMGDRVLVEVAKRLLAVVRSTDLVARIGGDEFVVVMPGLADEDHIQRLCEAMLSAVQAPIDGVGSGPAMVVGASIGVAIYPEDAQTSESLLMRADAAMYAVKRTGRGGFRYVDDERNERLRERVRRFDELGRALDAGRVALVEVPYGVRDGVVDATPQAVLCGLQCIDELGLPSGLSFEGDRLDPALAISASLKTLELALVDRSTPRLRAFRLAADVFEGRRAFARLMDIVAGGGPIEGGVAFRFAWRRLESLSAPALERLARVREAGVALHLEGLRASDPVAAVLARYQPRLAVLEAFEPGTMPGDAGPRVERAFIATCEAFDVIPVAVAHPGRDAVGDVAALPVERNAPAEVRSRVQPPRPNTSGIS